MKNLLVPIFPHKYCYCFKRAQFGESDPVIWQFIALNCHFDLEVMSKIDICHQNKTKERIQIKFQSILKSKYESMYLFINALKLSIFSGQIPVNLKDNYKSTYLSRPLNCHFFQIKFQSISKSKFKSTYLSMP